MDPKIVEAIEEAVREKDQSDALARRLTAWFDAVSSGNEDLNDRQSADRHLELLYGEVQLDGISAVTGNAITSDESIDSEDVK